jgi:hypothetical protein
MGLAALDAVMRRARAAPLMLSLSLLRKGRGWGGRRHAHVRVCLRRASGPHILFHGRPAMGWYNLIRETERAVAGLGLVCVYV